MDHNRFLENLTETTADNFNNVFIYFTKAGFTPDAREAKLCNAFRVRSDVYTSLDQARMRSTFRLLNE